MDKVRDWSWLPAQMPGVAAAIKRQRAEVGNGHVNLCWRRGVVDGLPGWFYAAEGALAVGTPGPEVLDLACARLTPDQTLLVLRPVETAHG